VIDFQGWFWDAELPFVLKDVACEFRRDARAMDSRAKSSFNIANSGDSFHDPSARKEVMDLSAILKSNRHSI
jgi:hypothetical protein